MSETNDQETAKGRLSLRPAGRLELGRTVDAGSVRQSFSHGRSKVVQVEVRKKRAPVGAPGSAAERARFLGAAGESVTVLDPLPAAALGRVFGRDHVVHVAIAPGRLGERLAVEAVRLRGLRRDGGGGKTGADKRTHSDGTNG